MLKLIEECLSKLIPNQKYTLWKFTEMGMPMCIKITFKEIQQNPYAQYKNPLELIFTRKNQRTLKSIMICRTCEPLIIWNGWLDIEDNMFVNKSKTGAGLTLSNSLLCFAHEYIDRAIQSTKQKPLIFQDYYIIPAERENQKCRM